MRVVTRKRPLGWTGVNTAGMPAKSCVCTKAREMIVTESPTGQSPADPLTTTTTWPRSTDAGATVSDGAIGGRATGTTMRPAAPATAANECRAMRRGYASAPGLRWRGDADDPRAAHRELRER